MHTVHWPVATENSADVQFRSTSNSRDTTARDAATVQTVQTHSSRRSSDSRIIFSGIKININTKSRLERGQREKDLTFATHVCYRN